MKRILLGIVALTLFSPVHLLIAAREIKKPKQK